MTLEENMEVELTIAEAKLGSVFVTLQNICDMSQKITLDNLSLFLLKVDDIPKIRKEFVDVLDEVHRLNLTLNPSKYKVDYKKLTAFDEMVDKILTVKLAASNTLQRQNPTTPTPTPPDSGMKLPRINLTPFDGKIENWASFHQMFDTYVHKRIGISDFERLNLLVNNLTGAARSIIKGIILSAENYQLIYRTLVERYQDQQELANYYLNIIMNFKTLSRESEKGLNLFLEQVVDSVAALKLVGINDLFDYFLVFLSARKLDSETYRRFEMEHRGNTVPTFDQLTEFVRSQAKILGRNKSQAPKTPSVKNSESKTTHAFVAQNQSPPPTPEIKKAICPLCKTPRHAFFRCEVFRTMDAHKRYQTAKKHKYCLNCLGFSHMVSECPSEQSCSSEGCNQKHHSLLHFVRKSTRSDSTSQADDSTSKSPNPESNSNVTTALTTSSSPASIVLLSTAQVCVKDKSGNSHLVRALLDTGSMSHFISRRVCEKLALPRSPVNTTVKCLGKGSAQIKEKSKFSFSSRVAPHVEFQIEALVMDELMDLMPSVPVSLDNFSHLNGLVLADPSLNVPGPVDMIIGAALIPHILLEGKIVNTIDSPVALNSSLGWIIMGTVPLDPSVVNSCLSVETPLETILQKFWKIEEVPQVAAMSEDDKACEEHFMKNFRREADGTFVVALPFKHQPELLGDSLKSATYKFFSLEKRLVKDEKLYQQYRDVVNNHISLGHFALVSTKMVRTAKPSYYMPHHGVVKSGSSSTPLRIVLNASARSSTNFSLNDLLFVGPRLQTAIVEVLLNFRLFKFALSADAKQMYLQIKIRESDRQYQRLLWRPSCSEPLQIYEVTRVAFGVATSPYLAQKVVRILANEHRERYPSGATSIERDTYVDNVSCSVANEEELLKLKDELVQIFEAGRFTLAKWCSNSPKLMAQIPSELRLFEPHNFDSESTSNILGLIWNPARDTFAIKVNPPPDECSKRKMTSVVAKIFDPLGLLSPLTVVAKELIRAMWTAEADWDDEPPNHILQKWKAFISELEYLISWSIPRHSAISNVTRSQLIGFSDASQSAYGGVIYVRTTVNGCVFVRILCAKAKVAPVQVQSINRLELCGVLLLSKLLKLVISTFSTRFRFEKIFALTDSQVALQWLSSSPARWKTFVANRVSMIQENVHPSNWFHVNGNDNAADCLSRGLTAKALVEHPTWFEGPEWLKGPEDGWPIRKVDQKLEPKFPEQRIVSLVVQDSSDWSLRPILDRVSTYLWLIRTTVRVLRFCRILKTRVGSIQSSEIQHAEKMWLLRVQLEHFAPILDFLSSSNRLKKRKTPSPLIAQLGLFLDHGLIRVGGRLQNAKIPYDQRHPILLPNGGKFVELVIDPSAPCALTPAHFLTVGSTLDKLPAEDFTDTPSNRLDRYQLLDSMVQHFWQRWHAEYLSSLQKKYKWTDDSHPPTPGTVVLIQRDKSQPSPHPLQWPVGIIVDTMPGPDGIIRVAKVKTASGEYTRPLVKLCPLPRQ